MRRVFLALIFLILISCINSVETPSSVLSTSYQIVPEEVAFSIKHFNFSGSEAYAVLIGEDVYAILVQNPPSVKPKVLDNEKEISQALKEFYKANGFTIDALDEYELAHASISSLKNRRDKGEAACRILLGTDRNPCTDYESCIRACYSVTSFCQPVALGAGKPFINTILKFENDSRNLDEAYDAEGNAYAKVIENRTYENSLGYVDAVENLVKAAEEASQNRLFEDYSYCFAPDYSIQELKEVRKLVQEANYRASKAFFADSSAKEVLRKTRDGLKKMQKLEIRELERLEERQNTVPLNSASFQIQNEETYPGYAILYFVAAISLPIIVASFVYAALKQKK
ncbi:MAG: hypothetical protein QW275_02225 [Candidatus Anstonellaceae archaeon]